MTSSFRKVFWPALVAAALFAAVGFSADKASAQVVNFAGDGDACRIASTTGNTANVGETFSVVVRWQDAFYANARWIKDVDPVTAGNQTVVGGFMFTMNDVVSVDVSDQDGDINIIGKFDDQWQVHDLTWALLAGVTSFIGWGHVDRNAVPPVDFLHDLDIIHILSTDGDDPDDSDIVENFGPSDIEGLAQMLNLLAGECGDAAFAPSQAVLNTFINAFILGSVFDFAALPAAGEVALAMDGISAVQVTCVEPGTSRISFAPLGQFEIFNTFGTTGAPLYAFPLQDIIELFFDDEPEGASININCVGGAHSASSTLAPPSIEVHPVGTNSSVALVTVTALDQNGRRVDNVTVTFTSDDCKLGSAAAGPFGGTTLVTSTDSDSASDLAFVASHSAAGDELYAGTAEAYLQCDNPGQATPTNNDVLVTYVVTGTASGTGLTGTQTVKVVGQPDALTLTATPTTSTCGSAVTVSAKVVDSLGTNVSDGTLVFFTGPNDVGLTGGGSSAQGGIATTAGVATVTVSPGQGLANGTSTITISAITGGTDLNGHPVVQKSNSITITCSGPSVSAPAAPSVTVPNTGTGAIKPPNTGNAGLVADNGSSWSLFAVAGLVAFAVAGLASVKFARR